MARGETVSPRYAIGLGARAGVGARECVAFIRETSARVGVTPGDRAALFTIDSLKGEAGLAEAARLLGLELAFLPPAALRSCRDAVVTRSARIEALFGVGSIAEAAALAGAGPGAALLAPRAKSVRLTCAIARPVNEDAIP